MDLKKELETIDKDYLTSVKKGENNYLLETENSQIDLDFVLKGNDIPEDWENFIPAYFEVTEVKILRAFIHENCYKHANKATIKEIDILSDWFSDIDFHNLIN